MNGRMYSPFEYPSVYDQCIASANSNRPCTPNNNNTAGGDGLVTERNEILSHVGAENIRKFIISISICHKALKLIET